MEQKKKVTFSLPPKTIQMLKEYSKEKNLNMSILVQLALEQYIKKGGE